MAIVVFGRIVNIFICSLIANYSRTENKIDGKKKFFLVFCGVRGAMAFALAIKTKTDLPSVGPVFLFTTLIVISFTLLYSSFFLNLTLRRCDIISICEADNFEETPVARNLFDILKNRIADLNLKYLMPWVKREMEEESAILSPEKIARDINLYNSEKQKNNKLEIEKKGKIIFLNIGDSDIFCGKRSNTEVTIDIKSFKLKNLQLFE